MSITIRCPNPACTCTSQVPDHFRGQSVRCRSCRHKFKVPDDPSDSSAHPPTVSSEAAGHGTLGIASDPAISLSDPCSPPAQLGRFQLRGKVGAGAFGTVYRAFDAQLKREVALKVPHPGALENVRVLERFLREARAAARLRHPHIVPVLDAGEEGGQHYLASAFVKGSTLAEALDTQSLDFEQAARIVRALAEALAYAHKQGVVHRDIKPANVMVDEEGEPYLMDFGLAHRQDEADKLTRDGALLGTPAYMAPEQARGQEGEPLPASDQYSLGVVLYELLTGRTPFSGPPQIVIFNVLNQEPPSPCSLRVAIPRDLETICLKAMAREPERRYADCQALADDLRRWLEGEPIKARRLGIIERVIRAVKKRPLLTALGMLTAACLLVVGAVATNSMLKVRASRQARQADLERARQSAARAERQAGISQEKAREAEKQIANARAIRIQAERAKKEADQERERAGKSARAANDALAEAERRERAARQTLYEAHLKLAREALQKNDRARARAWLDRYRDSDLRTDEWINLLAAAEGREVVPVDPPRDKPKAPRPPAPERKEGDNGINIPRGDFPGLPMVPKPQPPGQKEADGADSGKIIRILAGHTDSIRSVCFSPDGKRLVTASDDRTVRIWDADTGKLLHKLKGHTGWVSCVCFSRDGRRLASASNDKTVRIWDADTGQQVRMLEGHTGALNSVSFSPDGKRLASASDDETVRVWDAETGQLVRSLEGHTGWVRSVCFSPDGKRLASASNDKTVRIWDVDSGKTLATLEGHTDWVCSVCFSPDGKRLASAGHDNTVRIWDAENLRMLRSLAGHTDWVLCVCFSADGKRLASAGNERIVRIWDAGTGKATRSLKGHESEVLSVCFSPDGKRLASSGNDKVVRIWDVSSFVPPTEPGFTK